MPKVLHALSDMEFDEISTVPSGDNIHAKIVLAKAAPGSLEVHTNTPNMTAAKGKKSKAVVINSNKVTPPDLDDDEDTGDGDEDDEDDTDNEDSDDWGDLQNNGAATGQKSGQGNGMSGDEANAQADEDDDEDQELEDDVENASDSDEDDEDNSQNEDSKANRARKGVGATAEGATGILPVSFSRSRKAMAKSMRWSAEDAARHAGTYHIGLSKIHVRKDGHIDLMQRGRTKLIRAGTPNHSAFMSMVTRPGVSGDLEKSDNRFAGMTKAEIKSSISKSPVDLILRHGRKKAGLGLGNICPHCGGLLGGKADPALHTHEQCEIEKNSRGNILDHLEVFHNKRGLRGKGLRGLVVFHRVLHEHGNLNHDVTSRAITRPKEVEKGAHWGGDARPPKPSVPGDLASHIKIQHGVDPGGEASAAMHIRLHKIGKVLHPHVHSGLFFGKSDIRADIDHVRNDHLRKFAGAGDWARASHLANAHDVADEKLASLTKAQAIRKHRDFHRSITRAFGKSDISKSISAADRAAIPLSDFADKVHRKFPIDTPAHAHSAWMLRGRSTCGCDKTKIASAIKRIAGRKGFKLPDAALAKSDEVVLSKGLVMAFSHMDRAGKVAHINRAHGIPVARGMSELNMTRIHNAHHRSGEFLHTPNLPIHEHRAIGALPRIAKSDEVEVSKADKTYFYKYVRGEDVDLAQWLKDNPHGDIEKYVRGSAPISKGPFGRSLNLTSADMVHHINEFHMGGRTLGFGQRGKLLHRATMRNLVDAHVALHAAGHLAPGVHPTVQNPRPRI